MSLNSITPEGEGFLKTATAAPDFVSTDLEGIPDHFSGPSVIKKDFAFQTIDCPAGKATYLVVAPTACVAYYRPQVPPDVGAPLVDATILTGFQFPDAQYLFEGAYVTATEAKTANSTIVEKGRLMTLAAELVCTNNAFNRYGTVSAWKLPLARSAKAIDFDFPGDQPDLAVSGTQGFAQPVLNSAAYIQPVVEGAYAVTMNREEEFSFFPIIDGLTPQSIHPGLISEDKAYYFKGCAPLWDNSFDTIVFRIDVPGGVVDQSFIFKIWKAWEYQPTFNSLLYNMSHLSPQADSAALDLYRDICRELPMAVPARDNPDFWNTVLSLVKTSSKALSVLPGPVGTTAKGVHAISELLARKKNNTPRRPRALPRPTLRAKKTKNKRNNNTKRQPRRRRT